VSELGAMEACDPSPVTLKKRLLFISFCSSLCKILQALYACMLIRKGSVASTRSTFRSLILFLKQNGNKKFDEESVREMGYLYARACLYDSIEFSNFLYVGTV
jgi:hypothetical protein